MNSSIVAIGGGEIKSGATAEIDRYIVELCGKPSPTILFLPTASHDAGGCINVVSRVYRQLGCHFSSLLLYRDPNALSSAAEKFDAADIIYVGGGDTAAMLQCFDERGITERLKSAYLGGGKVLCGLSAGAICWFSYGYSDCFAGEHTTFSEVPALGFIDAVCCPHYDEPGRDSFDSYLAGSNKTGIAIENQSALVLSGDRFSALGNGVWRLDSGSKTRLTGEPLPRGELI